MRIIFIAVGSFFFCILHLSLSGQPSNNVFLVEKAKTDSVASLINSLCSPELYVSKLEGIDKNHSPYTAYTFFRPGLDSCQKISLYYKDSAFNKSFLYDQGVLLRIDFKKMSYYNISNKIFDEKGILVESSFSEDLMALGIWLKDFVNIPK